MRVTKQYLNKLIVEELTKSDVRDLIDAEFKKQLKRYLPDILEDELKKTLKKAAIKTDVGEIAKEVLKKLYKDLAYKHPYIIDRIKV
tara:strand:+ start:163 stop:423 length:261 start_codon:yes stop_codon:yes gene_type:complete